MEPDSSADNTTLANVSIHSTLRQVTWDKFNGTVLTDPSVSIKEINNSYNVILLDYVVTATGDNGELEYYNVEEYYRVRYTNDRMYLLNFERTMDEIFRAENDDFYENYLQLGICSSDVEYKSNETGSILCFVKEGELWCYNATEKSFPRCSASVVMRGLIPGKIIRNMISGLLRWMKQEVLILLYMVI